MSQRFDSLTDGSFASPFAYEFWPALESTSSKLLIVLHGRGDSPEGFHFLPAALAVDELNVLFLQAPDEYGTGYSWYGLPPGQAPGIVRSRAGLFELLDKLRSEVGVVPRDVFVFGFSQGCLMSLDLALRYPHCLGGVVGISGYVFFEDEYPEALSPVSVEQRIWVSHGFQDEVLPFAKSQASIDRLRALKVQIEWVPLQKGHTIDEVDEIPLIRAFLRTQLTAN